MFSFRKDRVRSLWSSSGLSTMLKVLNHKLERLCSKFRWPARRPVKPKIVIRRFGRHSSKFPPKQEDRDRQQGLGDDSGQIQIASFNAAMFSMAPAVPKAQKSRISDCPDEDYSEAERQQVETDIRGRSKNDPPKSILKQAPASNSQNSELTARQRSFAKSKLRVSINLPDNEISLERNQREKAQLQSNESFSSRKAIRMQEERLRSDRTVLEVLREVDADILGLQDVKADEENGMKPLSDLADALGMKYVFAESWAPEYGNAVLSKWPIKRWKVQKIFDDTDFRNVLKVTVDVPNAGEVNFYCTHLDHLDENWRMKQINAILQSDDDPHILAGGLNSLDETDYSEERWTDIVKYYEEIGKPTPKVEVMKFLKGKNYVDAKDFAGECESVVIIAKGQDVQGTCKYGTRVDYILASSDSPYKFVPGSYSVISSKGTSDHHIVRASIKVAKAEEEVSGRQQRKKRVVRITSSSSRGIWALNSSHN